NIITWTIDDGHGNTATCTSVIVIEDNEPPAALCQDVTIQLDATGNGGITAAQVDNGSADACGIASTALDITAFDCGDVGLNAVVLTVEDNNSNVDTCHATVTVQDLVLPVALCQDVTVELDGVGNASITAGQVDNGSTDACGIASTVLDETDFDCAEVGANAVVLTVEDNNSNVDTCHATVTVMDNVVPTITCPGDVTLEISAAECDTVFIYNVVTTDNCTGETVDVLSGLGSGAAFEAGLHTEVLQVTDQSGNTSSCSFSITVLSIADSVETTICFGDSLFVGGAWQYLPGAYPDTLTNAPGCDSVVVTVLDTTTECYWPSEIVYVDSSAVMGANTGVDWPNAYLDLQLALDIADRYLNVGQIWMAAGTYYPTQGTDRSVSFTMVDSIAILGGFAGTETDLAQRGDPLMQPTRLSGDIGVVGDSTDNSYHIIDCPAAAVEVILDGLIMEDALANGPSPEDQTGAALLVDGHLRLTQCIIQQVAASGSGQAIQVAAGAFLQIGNTVIVK
ncbi:MAG: HYR domain-containing protein, partial [Saprospiraceae bacterium]|nr:HYR domain-containing protein [Saprospiraceae bacterium]